MITHNKIGGEHISTLASQNPNSGVLSLETRENTVLYRTELQRAYEVCSDRSKY